MARLFIPPSAVAAIQTPRTFAKIEARAAHSLTGHGRQLYVLLADKKNMQQSHWTYTVAEMRALMGCEDKKTYQVWAQFDKWVLQPALKQVNDFGTVSVKMTAKRLGRTVEWIRFDWNWKDPHEAGGYQSRIEAEAPVGGAAIGSVIGAP
ncbi:replication initiation protein [Rhodovulum sulfidophilum]